MIRAAMGMNIISHDIKVNIKLHIPQSLKPLFYGNSVYFIYVKKNQLHIIIDNIIYYSILYISIERIILMQICIVIFILYFCSNKFRKLSLFYLCKEEST